MAETDERVRLVGVDLAWQTERNGSALAAGTLAGRYLTIDYAQGGITGLDEVLGRIAAQGEVRGVAVDAPLIINNALGQRPCEKALSRDYRARKAGCHASNLKLYPDAGSVRLASRLLERGHQHLGGPEHPWQLECYPHPAIIELFGLPERLRYKKGTVKHKRGGQIRLAQLLLDRARRHQFEIHIDERLRAHFDVERIAMLKGQALKHNEDVLDAIVCVLIAAHYQAASPRQVYGDTRTGYIVVPCPKRSVI